MLRIIYREKKYKNLIELSDFELFECYKKCDNECFANLYEKHRASINSVIHKIFNDQFMIDHEDIFHDKVLMFLEKKKPEKKDLNKEKKKNLKSLLTTAFINHGLNFLKNVKNKQLYLNAKRKGSKEYEDLENNVLDERKIEVILKELEQFISLNETQKEFLKLYCFSDKDEKLKDIAKKINRSKSYTENLLTQIRQKIKKHDNRELIIKIINHEL